MPESVQTLLGKQGEFLILGNLCKLGISAYHIDAADTDIICVSSNERPIRIQVKAMVTDAGKTFLMRKRSYDRVRQKALMEMAGKKSRNITPNMKDQKTSYGHKDFEILACVVLDTEEIFYLNMEAAKKISTDRSGGSITLKKLRLFTYDLTVYQGWNKAVSKYYPNYKVELNEDGSVISRLNGNGPYSSECSESEFQQGVLF